jgi:hypothetical protein
MNCNICFCYRVSRISVFALTLLTAWLSIVNALAQTDCETIDPHLKGDFFYDKFKEYTTYRLLVHPSDSIYCNNRAEMTMIQPVFLKNNEAVFEWDSFKLRIKTQKIPFSSLKNVSIMEISDPTVLLITSIDNSSPYGLNYPKDTARIISEMSYQTGSNEIKIPESAFKDLFYPNMHQILGPIRPVEMYLNHESTYLYIYGANLVRDPSLGIDAYDTYLAKLVFNASGFQTRIIANEGELKAYGWPCENFIGF